MLQRTRLLHCIALVAVLAGCESLPLRARSTACNVATAITAGAACEPMDAMPEPADRAAKQFAVDAERAHLYIVRPSLVGGRYAWAVQVDGRDAGRLAEHTFMLLTVAPGRHEVAVQTAENRHAIVLEAGAGENRFIELTARLGWTQSKAEARVMERGQGVAAVRDSRRVGTP